MKQIKPSYSTLSASDLLDKVVGDYQIHNPTSCSFWSRGFNDTYLVCAGDAKYSLRVYRKDLYPREAVEFEVDALNFLHLNDFPVAYPIPRNSGGFVSEVAAPEGKRLAIVTAFAEGCEPDYDKAGSAEAFGSSLAKMHQITDSFRSNHCREDINTKLLVDDSVAIITPHVLHRPAELKLLEELADRAKRTIGKIPSNELDIGFCHGDVHGYNAHFHDGIVTHFDFEECGIGYRLYDIATFRWNNDDTFPAGFLEGYEQIRKLGQHDHALLDTFVLIRHIALIGMHMKNADDFGHELTSNEYIDRQWKQLRKLAAKAA